MNPIRAGVPSGFGAGLGPIDRTSNIGRTQSSEVAEKEDDVSPNRLGKGRAMRIFRHEAVLSLLAQFRNSFTPTDQFTDRYTDLESAEHTATEILSAARNIVKYDPGSTSKIIINIRQKIEQAISATREVVTEIMEAVDDAVGIVDGGLDSLENQIPVANSTTSTVLVDAKSRQRSTSRIETQEGDLVKFDLRRVDRLSATDVAVSGEQGLATSTELLLSSRSRLMLNVGGDLDESELAAIQDVFAQAEALADEFFSGDTAAAFDFAAGLDIDAEQLTKVSLKFKVSESTRITQSVLQNLAPAPTPDRAIDIPGAEIASDQVLPPATVDAVSDPVNISTTTDDTTIDPKLSPVDPGTPVAPAGFSENFDALLGFLQRLVDFLNEIADHFNSGSPRTVDSDTLKYRFSQATKLEILKVAFYQIAPDPKHDSVDVAYIRIDTVGAKIE